MHARVLGTEDLKYEAKNELTFSTPYFIRRYVTDVADVFLQLSPVSFVLNCMMAGAKRPCFPTLKVIIYFSETS